MPKSYIGWSALLSRVTFGNMLCPLSVVFTFVITVRTIIVGSSLMLHMVSLNQSFLVGGVITNIAAVHTFKMFLHISM